MSEPPDLASSATLEIHELLDRILQSVEDGLTLKSCSLVSRLWSGLSSPYLFRTIILDPTAMRSLPDATEPYYAPLASYQRVTTNVKKVVLSDFKKSGMARGRHHDIPVQRFADIVVLFPHMKNLCFGPGTLPRFSPGLEQHFSSYDYQSPTPLSRQLDELDLDLSHLSFAEVSMGAVLEPFSRIKNLNLNICLWNNETPARTTSETLLARQTKVDNLQILFCGSSQSQAVLLYQHIAANIDIRSITSFNLQYYHPQASHSPHLHNFLRGLANLEDLTIGIDFLTFDYCDTFYVQLEPVRKGCNFAAGFDFSFDCCKRLRTLAFELAIDGRPTLNGHDNFAWQSQYIWAPAMDFLLRGDPDTLSRIRLGLSYFKMAFEPFEDPFPVLDWGLVDRLLDRYPHLELEILLPDPSWLMSTSLQVYPSAAEMQHTIAANLSDRLNRVVQFKKLSRRRF